MRGSSVWVRTAAVARRVNALKLDSFDILRTSLESNCGKLPESDSEGTRLRTSSSEFECFELLRPPPSRALWVPLNFTKTFRTWVLAWGWSWISHPSLPEEGARGVSRLETFPAGDGLNVAFGIYYGTALASATGHSAGSRRHFAAERSSRSAVQFARSSAHAFGRESGWDSCLLIFSFF